MNSNEIKKINLEIKEKFKEICLKYGLIQLDDYNFLFKECNIIINMSKNGKIKAYYKDLENPDYIDQDLFYQIQFFHVIYYQKYKNSPGFEVSSEIQILDLTSLVRFMIFIEYYQKYRKAKLHNEIREDLVDEYDKTLVKIKNIIDI